MTNNKLNSKDILSKVLPIEGWLENNEIITLNDIARRALSKLKNNEFLIEIGSYKGRSTVAIALACKEYNKGVLIAIDPHKKAYFVNHPNFKGTISDLKINLMKNNVTEYVQIVRDYSSEAFKKFRNYKTKFIFIDGDHRINVARKDYKNWSSTLQEGGFLLLHDSIDVYGPRLVLGEILKNQQFSLLGIVGNLACFQKVNKLTLKQRLKKLYSIIVLKLLFYKIYTPYDS